MSANPLYLWDPTQHSTVPQTFDEAVEQLRSLFEVRQAASERFRVFAQHLQACVQHLNYSENPNFDDYRNLNREIPTWDKAVLSLSLPYDDAITAQHLIVNSATHAGLAVFDDNYILLFMPDGRILPRERRYGWEDLVRESAKLKADLPKTSAAFKKVIHPPLMERLKKLGFKKGMDSQGKPALIRILASGIEQCLTPGYLRGNTDLRFQLRLSINHPALMEIYGHCGFSTNHDAIVVELPRVYPDALGHNIRSQAALRRVEQGLDTVLQPILETACDFAGLDQLINSDRFPAIHEEISKGPFRKTCLLVARITGNPDYDALETEIAVSEDSVDAEALARLLRHLREEPRLLDTGKPIAPNALPVLHAHFKASADVLLMKHFAHYGFELFSNGQVLKRTLAEGAQYIGLESHYSGHRTARVDLIFSIHFKPEEDIRKQIGSTDARGTCYLKLTPSAHFNDSGVMLSNWDDLRRLLTEAEASLRPAIEQGVDLHGIESLLNCGRFPAFSTTTNKANLFPSLIMANLAGNSAYDSLVESARAELSALPASNSWLIRQLERLIVHLRERAPLIRSATSTPLPLNPSKFRAIAEPVFVEHFDRHGFKKCKSHSSELALKRPIPGGSQYLIFEYWDSAQGCRIIPGVYVAHNSVQALVKPFNFPETPYSYGELLHNLCNMDADQFAAPTQEVFDFLLGFIESKALDFFERTKDIHSLDRLVNAGGEAAIHISGKNERYIPQMLTIARLAGNPRFEQRYQELDASVKTCWPNSYHAERRESWTRLHTLLRDEVKPLA